MKNLNKIFLMNFKRLTKSHWTGYTFLAFYVFLIIFLTCNYPVLYILLLIPLSLACVIFKYLSKANAKFLKEFNDTILYFVAFSKALAYAGLEIDKDFFKEFVNYMHSPNVFISTWVLILTCTFIKTIICLIEAVSALVKKEKNLKLIVTPVQLSNKYMSLLPMIKKSHKNSHRKS